MLYLLGIGLLCFLGFAFLGICACVQGARAEARARRGAGLRGRLH